MKSLSTRPAEPGTGKPVECPYCGWRFVDKRSLRQHVAAAHAASESTALIASSINGLGGMTAAEDTASEPRR